MRPTEEHPVLLQGLKTAQIIVGALLAGVVIFSAILLFGVRPPQVEPQEGALPLTWVLLGTGVLEAITFLVLRGVILARVGQRIAATPHPLVLRAPYAEAGDAGRLFQGWLQATILGAAAMEAGALMALVAYLLEGQPAALIAAGVFGLLLALQMPTQGRLDPWLESELLKLQGPGEKA